MNHSQIAWFKQSEFDAGADIGKGAYGTVRRHTHLASERLVAIKHCKFGHKSNGIPYWVIREMAILETLNKHGGHANIVRTLGRFFGVASYGKMMGIVFELLDIDLGKYYKAHYKEQSPMPISEVRHLTRQLCKGLEYCHSHRVMHRDLKPVNILLTKPHPVNLSRTLKIADFGLSRIQNDVDKDHSNNVVTLYYRSPEVILGSQRYTTDLDMWSVGCIIMELYMSDVLFAGESEVHVLAKIMTSLGVPPQGFADQITPDKMNTFQEAKAISSANAKKRPARVIHRDDCRPLLDVVNSLVVYNPADRKSASAILGMPFFMHE